MKRSSGWTLLGAAIIPLALAAGSFSEQEPPREKPLELKSATQRVTAPLNLGSLHRVGLLAAGGSPSKLGGLLPALDLRLDTQYEAREPGPASIHLTFARPQNLQEVRLLLGSARCQWSLEAADTLAEIEAKGSTAQVLVPLREKRAGDAWEEVKLPAPIVARTLRLHVIPAAPGDRAVVRELNLIGEQTLEAIFAKVRSNALPQNEAVPLQVTGYFSGGGARLLEGKGLRWTITPENAARMSTHNRIIGRRKGAFQVTVAFDRLVSPPLALEVVEPD